LRKIVVMEQQAATRIAGHDSQVIDAYGRFLRQTLQSEWPQESQSKLDELEQEARRQFGQALERAAARDSLTLYQIAVTTTLTIVRRYQQQLAAQAIAWVDLKAPTENPELMQRLREALSRLPDQRRRVLGLHHAGLTIPEMAELLGWSEAKVRKQLQRGKQTLRATLREAGIEYESD
jgi:RNA polymerase sigma factor (sigma-70 family)